MSISLASPLNTKQTAIGRIPPHGFDKAVRLASDKMLHTSLGTLPGKMI